MMLYKPGLIIGVYGIGKASDPPFTLQKYFVRPSPSKGSDEWRRFYVNLPAMGKQVFDCRIFFKSLK